MSITAGPGWRWRPMTTADLPAVMRIGDEVHRELPEDEDVFRERLLLFPAGCRVLEVDGSEDYEGGRPVTPEQDAAQNRDGNGFGQGTEGKEHGRHAVIIGGYILSFPIQRNRPPALNARLPGGSLPAGADQYYLHDVAVLPRFRGRGAASAAVLAVLDCQGPAATYETCSLVSVYGTEGFWERLGFRVVITADGELVNDGWEDGPGEQDEVAFWEVLREKLKGYGKDAKFMVRRNLTT